MIVSFTVAILLPLLVAVAVGVNMLHRQVRGLAQSQIDSDLEAGKEIVRNRIERLKDAVRIHATRRVLYNALEQRDTVSLKPEAERALKAEGLDILTLVDDVGTVRFRTRNPSLAGDSQEQDAFVQRVLRERAPVSGLTIVPEQELLKESSDLAGQAAMRITPTPMAGSAAKAVKTSGLMIKAAAPVFSPNGDFLGVLYGAVLVNRNCDIVDMICRTVFKERQYQGRAVGVASIFQDDVRIATNVSSPDNTRAIATRAAGDVAAEVLQRGNSWRARAFVLNEWYITAYEPLRDIQGRTIGMLAVGTLERPYWDALWHTLFIYLGITLLGVALGSCGAFFVARNISRPIRAMALAAQRVAQGDYTQKVEIASHDEIGYLAVCFNKMTLELTQATRQLREWADNLESKVEQRTAEIRAMQEHLVKAEKLAAIGKLAAGVAHEINNPLTGVLTNSSLLLEDLPPDSPMREDLQIIVSETLRCRNIVKGLLEFSRQTQPHKQVVDMNSVLVDVLNLVRNQTTVKNVKLDTELDPNLPTVVVDRDQMRQVILNIVLNATESMPAGGSIRIASRQAPGDGQIEVSISDTGVGIPDEIKGKLFEPFFTTKKSGTGLGLAIAYGIMEQHKGTIAIDSVPGRGTTITLRIPAKSANDDD